jgi:hypothetical protein
MLFINIAEANGRRGYIYTTTNVRNKTKKWDASKFSMVSTGKKYLESTEKKYSYECDLDIT